MKQTTLWMNFQLFLKASRSHLTQIQPLAEYVGNKLDDIQAYEKSAYHPEAEGLLIKEHGKWLTTGWKQEMVVMKLLLRMVKIVCIFLIQMYL